MAHVEIYTRDSCVWCDRARRILIQAGARFEQHHVDEDLFDLLERTGKLTVPQILIDDRLVGGYQDLVQWKRDGRLETALHG